jgi:hypothetical protein
MYILVTKKESQNKVETFSWEGQLHHPSIKNRSAELPWAAELTSWSAPIGGSSRQSLV